MSIDVNDKAKDHADAAIKEILTVPVFPPGPTGIEEFWWTRLVMAFKAGYSQGQADANRKETAQSE